MKIKKYIYNLLVITLFNLIFISPLFPQFKPLSDLQIMGGELEREVVTNNVLSHQVSQNNTVVLVTGNTDVLDIDISKSTSNYDSENSVFIDKEKNSTLNAVATENLNLKKQIKISRLKQNSLSNELVNDDVERKYFGEMKLIYPEKETLLIKPTIQIKGINRFLTEMFVNGESIKLRKDGRFFHSLTLNQFGKQNVYITYALANYEPYTVRRKVTYLVSPPDIETFILNRQVLIGFYNLPFFS